MMDHFEYDDDNDNQFQPQQIFLKYCYLKRSVDQIHHSERLNAQQSHREEEPEPTLAETISQVQMWIKHSLTLEKILTYLLYYFFLQLIFTILELVHEGDNSSTYTNAVLIQYLLHIVTTYQLRKTASQRTKDIQRLIANNNISRRDFLRLEGMNGVTLKSLWHNLQSQHQRLTFVNKVVFAWMWLYGNFQIFFKSSKVSSEFLVLQLAIGWSICSLITLFASLICIIVPTIYCYMCLKEKYQRRRRQQNLQKLKDRVTQYGRLKQKGDQPCYICLEEYQLTDLVVEINCDIPHIFHIECLEPWLEKNEFCPVCRSLVK